jgi:putative two-component system response regulator
MTKMIFVVDDSDTNLAVANEALKQQYNVMTLPSAERLFDMLKKVTPDLILLDIEMPEMNGFEALRQLKASDLYADIPVIFLTSRSESSNEAYGIELGATDFIGKPFSKPVLLNRIKYHLHIDDIVRERTAQLLKLQNGIVFAMADLVENRDKNTGGHIKRTELCTKMLVDAMMKRNVYYGELHSWNLELFVSSVRLHDVGKIVIPGSILNKPGPLTDDEFQLMKTHTVEGERIIDNLVQQIGIGDIELLHNAQLTAAYHHARWDGSGYPHGLKGTDIPLQGRIVAIIDVYDALVSERPYKKPLSEEEAISTIKANVGKYFDPNIANVFIEIKDQLRKVYGLGE